MDAFLDAALGFPTVLFSFAVALVLVYWLLALTGVLDLGSGGDAGGSDGADGGGFGPGAALNAVGLGGVPATVALSLLVAAAWFVSLVGNVVLESLGVSGAGAVILGILVLVIAVTVAWGLTSGVAMGLRRFLPGSPVARTSGDLVGRTCVVRTLRVDAEFGQAEVRASDGSTLLIQVRTIASEPLASGDTALIFDHDAAHGAFRVAPFDPALDPGDA